MTVQSVCSTSIPDAFHCLRIRHHQDLRPPSVHNKSTYHTEDAVHAGVGLQFLGLKGKTGKMKDQIKFANEKKRSGVKVFLFFFFLTANHVEAAQQW